MIGTRATERPAISGGPERGLSTRLQPLPDGAVHALFESAGPLLSPIRAGLTARLKAAYDGELEIALRSNGPTIVANFVETIDGVVALDTEGRTGGGEISGFDPGDRFVMALLRALADAVLVGAGTVRASDGGAWTGARLRPDLADELAAVRARLGLPPHPVTFVVTASGRLSPGLPGFRDPTVPIVIAASIAGVERLQRLAWPDHIRIEPLRDDVSLGRAVVDLASRLGLGLVLSEAGPHVAGQLMADGLVDELFLTVAPQLVGRSRRAERLSLIEGHALWPDRPSWARLVSIRLGGDHLFLRYRLKETRDEA